MGIETTFIDAATGDELARTVLEPEQLPETFAISTTLTLGEEDWVVVASDPVTRGEITRAGRLRLTLRKRSAVRMHPAKAIKFSMPTICDALPAADPAVSLADIRVFVIDEDLWRDVEWVPPLHSADIEVNFTAVGAIRALESGPFSKCHLRVTPIAPMHGTGLTVPDVADALGAEAVRLDGIVIDTMGAGFIAGGFAFRLPDSAHVYGFCDGDEIMSIGVHREGGRESLPAALVRLADLLRSASGADLIVWPYCEQLGDSAALEDWYRSGRACTKLPW